MKESALRSLGTAVCVALAVGVALGAPPAAVAQAREKPLRIGVLEPGRAPGGGCVEGFRKGLRDFGYIDGKTVTVDYRFADGNSERIAVLAGEIVRQAPDLLWTHSPLGALAARQASATIPVVVGVGGHLVEQGLAASLPRPGGNVTGFELGDIELAGKRLQLLKEAVPSLARVAVLVDPAVRSYDEVPRNIEPEARKLGVHLQRVEAGSPEAFEGAVAAAVRGGAEALMVVDVPLFVRNSPRLMKLALQHRLPTISGWRRYAEAGSLLSYGPNLPDVCRSSAEYVDKILKGAKPGDLPVRLPEKFELIVNRRTAEALGLAIPSSILIGANEVLR